MQIYISKNNQQLGPFEESRVLEMINAGELSANDLAIRQGDTEWQKLGNYFPNAGNTAPVTLAAVEPTVPKKSRKGLLLGCGGFLVIALVISGILGLLAYRNLYPADSTEDLPDKVKDLKLANRYPPKGNVWGTETNFVGLYGDESKTKTVLYLMTVFSDEATAKAAMRTELAKSCQTGETPMYFSFKKDGTEMSQGATCAVPLYVQKGNKLATIGGSGASADTFIEFAENLPFNSGATMTKIESK